MDMVSACNKAGKWFDSPLSAIPASASFLRPKFARLHPDHVGVSQRRIDNVRSLLLRAFRVVGVSTSLQPYGCPLSPQWQELFDSIEKSYDKSALSRFVRFCSRQGIAPGEVDDAVMDKFLQALIDETFITHSKLTHQTCCRCWNTAVRTIEGWPRREVTVPRYDEGRRYALGPEQLHPDLVEDIESYLEILQGHNLFKGPKKPFRPASIRSVRGNLMRYLAALQQKGVEVAKVRRLEEVVPFEVFEQGMEWFLERNGGEVTRSIGDIAWTVRVLALKHVGVDEKTEALYREAIARLCDRTIGLSEKNREALFQFDDPAVVRRFLNCPDQLWKKAEVASGRKARLLAESAIAIELLIYAPVRFKNLRSVRRDRHLSWRGDRLHLHFKATEVKNVVELDMAVPRFAGQRLRHFLETYHGQYLDGPNPHLFAGRGGKPKDETCLRRQITRALFEETGIELTPHQFRHAGAKLLLEARPGHYEVVRKLLGHKNLSTVYESYSGTETQAAIDLYDHVILDLKHDRAPATEAGAGKDHKWTNRKGGKTRSSQNPSRPPFMDPLNLFGKPGDRS
jgi:integrase